MIRQKTQYVYKSLSVSSRKMKSDKLNSILYAKSNPDILRYFPLEGTVFHLSVCTFWDTSVPVSCHVNQEDGDDAQTCLAECVWCDSKRRIRTEKRLCRAVCAWPRYMTWGGGNEAGQRCNFFELTSDQRGNLARYGLNYYASIFHGSLQMGSCTVKQAQTKSSCSRMFNCHLPVR